VCASAGRETSLERVILGAADLGGQRGPGRDLQLLECAARVGVDRVRRDEQTLADLPVGQAFGDQLGDGPLALGQALPAGEGTLGTAPASRGLLSPLGDL